MKTTPLVSILIPAYNAGKWIEQTIESAVSQTWPCKEIIVVDDGSTDDTFERAKQFESKSVVVVSKENGGAAAARNFAFNLSKGDFIQWLDADDLLSPQKIELQVKALSDVCQDTAVASGPWGKFFTNPARAVFRPSPLWENLEPAEWLLRKMLTGAHMQTATWLVSREITEAAGPWNTRLLGDDDGEYFCRVLLNCKQIHFCSEAKVFYREVGSNRLSYIGVSNAKMDAQLLSIKLHLDYVEKLAGMSKSGEAVIAYLQKYMFDFWPERPDIVNELQHLAGVWGGTLRYPTSPPKYKWIHWLFGWQTSKQAQLSLPKIKQAWMRLWEQRCF